MGEGGLPQEVINIFQHLFHLILIPLVNKQIAENIIDICS